MDFQFDVFLSHSAKDKPVVRELAAQISRPRAQRKDPGAK
jgi:hypothetical protein